MLAFTMLAFVQKTDAYEPGSKAESFNLKNIDGKMLKPFEMKDIKGLIVVFTCNHCPYAKAYEDRIIKLDSIYKPQGYPVVAINPNDTVAYPDDSFMEMAKRAKEKGFTFPYMIDETQATAKAFGALKTPHVYVLHKDKKDMIVKYVGAIDDNYENESKVKDKYLENAMTELLAGKDITVKTTKAIGCTIKWKK